MKAIENRRKMAGQGGFTLIELLVVIAILGVLAGVVVFAVSGINNTSQESACKAESDTVNTAIQAFYAQENKYPNVADDTVTTPAGSAFDGEKTSSSAPNAKPFVGGFLKKRPTLVTITYGAAGANEPQLTWNTAGKCVTGTPPAPITGLDATP